ncbi:MAG: hypothetical protein WC634_04920 [archaeon]
MANSKVWQGLRASRKSNGKKRIADRRLEMAINSLMNRVALSWRWFNEPRKLVS